MSKRGVISILVLAAIVALGGWAEAAPVTSCPDAGGTQFLVDTAGEAASIGANGYSNTSCDLIVTVSIPPTVNELTILAKSIKLDGDDLLVNPLDIHMPLNVGKLFLTATGGDIVIDNTSIKAGAEARIVCQPATCKVDIKASELIVSKDETVGGPGGLLFIQSGALTDIQGTTTYGGDVVQVRSAFGSVIWKCGAGDTTCKDPTAGPKFPQIVKDKCGDPPVFPCNFGVLSKDDTKSICIGQPGVFCGGASKELDIIADQNIDIAGSKIDVTGTGIFNMVAKHGFIDAAGAELTGRTFNIEAGNSTKASPAIDLTGAKVTASANVRVIVYQNGCPALLTDICVDARQAQFITKKGGNFVRINGDSTPPSYDVNTDDTAVECTALSLGPVIMDKGEMFIEADKNKGRVVVCEALLN